jgi:alkylation response protein AidB-like acyl-CoA dehydrogenase
MDLTPTNAQLDIADSVAEYLAAEVSLGKLRQAMGSPPLIDDATWRQWASLGFFSLGIPEQSGGLGLGVAEELLIFKQFGRHLTPGPLGSTVLAAHLADRAGLPELTTRLMDGSERAGLRVGTTGFDVAAGGLALSLSADGAALERVRGARPLPGVDPMIEVSQVEAGDQVARVDGPELHTRHWILSAAALIGVAEAAERQSTSYARVRRQFGKPIGSFQAVKHRCADMRTRCYVAESQLRFAAVSVGAGRADGRFQAAGGLLLALQAARENTAVNIQNHGGIGFTSEHDAGLYLKRAVALEASLGSPAEWNAELLEPTRTEFA